MTTTHQIRPARFPEDAETVRQLFRDYANWLALDLDFQDFEAELAALPGKYAEPGGIVLLAFDPEGTALGCVAMRPLEDGACEMKRMFLLDAARGSGLGKALAVEVMARAHAAGYRRMVLDSLDRLTGAIRLYQRLGFTNIPAYYPNPLPDVIYMGRDLPA